MICPYCKNEMQKGILSGDGRAPVTWKQGAEKTKLIDRIVGSGTVTATRRTLATFTIEAFFCPDCRKMIFDTDVTR